MKKQLLLLVIMLLPMVASADAIEIDGIWYNLISKAKIAEVTKKPSGYYSGTIEIPAKITHEGEEYTVMKIGDYAFFYSFPASVNIPNSVTSIGNSAFSYCSLKSITIGNSVTSIGDEAFFNCNITSIAIPNSVTSIGSQAFQSCRSLTSISIPNSVADLGWGIFKDCTSLTSITIPSGVTSIGDVAFSGCTGLTSITIPNSVTSIGADAFSGCSGLTSITIPNSVVSIGERAFQNCKSLITVELHTAVIGSWFSGLTKIKEIKLCDEVTSIGRYAFSGCSGLSSITIPNNVKSIGGGAFESCTNLTSVHISDLEAWCKISFSNSLSNPLYIAHHLFLNGAEIKNLEIPNRVTSIGSFAFFGCSGLTSITIPNSVTSIEDHAFNECSGLTSITIGNSVTSIGDYAFERCSGLTSITIPNGVTKIGSYAFQYCSSMTSITIPNSVTSIGDFSTFRGCSSLTSIKIPNSVTSIGGGAFYGCSSLTSVTIPNNVTFIGGEAFKNCSELTDVTCLAENLPNTSSDAFDGSYIEYVTLHVPSESIKSYKTTSPWKDFGIIVEIPKTYYKLSYLVDNEEYKTYEIEEGATITPEPVPTKEGYTFSGWSEIPEAMPAHDVTVTGSFSINSYKLTYIVDGEEYKNFQIDYGTSIAAETEPTKEGYTFSGWSEIPETMPAHDVTVTGTFSVNSYSLTYVVDDEVYKTYEVEYGTDIIPEEVPQKTGYSFSGWNNIPSTMPAKDITISGTFTINSYKLTYVVDGVEYKTFAVEYDSAITPEEEPTKEGHTFSGWSEIPEIMPDHDVTITGSFIVNKYQVTYIIDGEVFATDYVEYGATIVPPTVEDKEGYTFDGWADVPKTMPAHNLTIYGSFTSGIAEIVMETKSNVRIYSPNGKKIEKFQKGLNIVVLKDGTVKKIVVK